MITGHTTCDFDKMPLFRFENLFCAKSRMGWGKENDLINLDNTRKDCDLIFTIFEQNTLVYVIFKLFQIQQHKVFLSYRNKAPLPLVNFLLPHSDQILT